MSNLVIVILIVIAAVAAVAGASLVALHKRLVILEEGMKKHVFVIVLALGFALLALAGTARAQEPPEFPDDYEFDFPDWPDMPPAPDYFPDHITCPNHPSLQPLTFPPSLGLPDMPTITLMSYITEVVSPIQGLTEAIMNWDVIIDSSLAMPVGIAEAAGFGIDDFGTPGGAPSMDIEIAGYTATGLADELVSGIDISLSYLRGMESIGVIGPTVASLTVGIAWITFIALVKIVLKPLLLAIHLVLEIWRLLPFT